MMGLQRDLVERTDTTSVCKLLEHFPDESSSVRRLFELRGGMHFQCPECGRRTSWLETGEVRIYISSCCQSRLDVMAGAWLSRVSLPVQSWAYLLALFSNEERPLKLEFLARHLEISTSKARAAITTIRNRIQLIMDATYDPSKFQNCYVDEYLYYHGKRWRRDPTRGTFVLCVGAPGGLRFVPAKGGRVDYPKVLRALGLATARLTTCNASLREILSQQISNEIRLSEWTMAAQNGDLVVARASISAFWPYFKRNMSRGRMTARGEHLNRYLSEYAFRFQERGKSHRIFAKLLGVVEQFE